MRRFAVFITTIVLATVFISQAQITESETGAPQTSAEKIPFSQRIKKEYPLIPNQPVPYVDEGSYSYRDEAWILRSNRAQRIAELEKAGIIVGILLTIFCVFMVTGATDVEWEKKITKENVPSDQ